MPKPIEIKALPGFHLWMRYEDGTEGEIDLSDLAGRGVFAEWNVEGRFEQVKLGERGQIAWNEDLELCPDAMYMRLTGKSPEEVFPHLGKANVDA